MRPLRRGQLFICALKEFAIKVCAVLYGLKLRFTPREIIIYSV